MGIKAVAFDVDGTLYPSIRLYIKSIGFFLQHPKEVIHFNRVRKKIRKVRPIENFHELQLLMFAESMGISGESARNFIENNMYKKWEDIFRGITIFPSVPPLLQRLKEKELLLAVLSDFPVDAKLGFLNLDGLWECALSAEDSGYLKPNREPFELLRDTLGLDGHEILYVGNSYEYDIEGAKKVGMKTAFFTKRRKREQKADIVFSAYEELLPKIEEIM